LEVIGGFLKEFWVLRKIFGEKWALLLLQKIVGKPGITLFNFSRVPGKNGGL